MEEHHSRATAWVLERPEGDYRIWSQSGGGIASGDLAARTAGTSWVVAFGSSELKGWLAPFESNRQQVERDFDAWRAERLGR